jgi:hypothetical protein
MDYSWSGLEILQRRTAQLCTCTSALSCAHGTQICPLASFSFSLNIFPPNPKKFPLKITHNIPSARANLLLCLLGCLSAKLPVSKNLCHWVIAPPANWPASGSLDTPIAVTVERSNLVDCNDIHVAVALSDILLKFGI